MQQHISKSKIYKLMLEKKQLLFQRAGEGREDH